MSAPAQALGLPPGFNFRPDAEELVELYLLPRARGQPAAIPGVVIEDASAAVPPWELLARHGRAGDNEAYFFERVGDGDLKGGGAARQGRHCGGSWTWVSQRLATPDDKVLPLPGSETVSWNRRALNLHRGRKRSGSMGWVLHEYTITSPPCPFPVKLCHVAFTGHGHKRQRLPDGIELQEQDSQPPHKRAAFATAAASSSSEASTTTFVDQEVGVPLGLDQERFLNQQPQAYNQEGQFQNYEGSSVLTSWDSDIAGSGQEPFALDLPSAAPTASLLDQELGVSVAQNQEQFTNQSQLNQGHFENFGAYCTLLSSDVGASQEQLLLQQLGQFLDLPDFPSTAPASADAAYLEERTQTTAPTLTEPGSMPPLMDHGSPQPWDDIDAFCDVSQAENYDGDGAFEEQGAI